MARRGDPRNDAFDPGQKEPPGESDESCSDCHPQGRPVDNGRGTRE